MESYNLDSYLKDSYYYQYPVDIEVESITFNSKKVKKGSIFVAIKGFKLDGNDYIDEAIKNNASIIVSEILPKKEYKNVGFLIVKDARNALSTLSQALFDFPDKKLKIIGITGTDGKTSTAFYTYNLLKQLNYKVGLISTTNIDIKNTLEISPYRQSTPDSNILFELLNQCVISNKEYVVLESTSHALSKEFNRLGTIEFIAAIITTISEEHLDFHKTHENYVNDKLSIINRLKDNGLLITTKNNLELEKTIKRATTLNKPCYILEESINFKIYKDTLKSSINLNYDNKEYKTNILSRILFNNSLLACLLINKITNITLDKILDKLVDIKEINGRFNIINNQINRLIIIDFAHTKDAFEHLFKELINENKKIISLFGCGGERDKKKRFEMGKIASKYSDIIILSEEDPRFENNENIMDDIYKGITYENNKCEVYLISNREKAIYKAFQISKENDILLFLGKGHETTIERNGIKYKYDEKLAILKTIKEIYG